jgi:hypothetical protein
VEVLTTDKANSQFSDLVNSVQHLRSLEIAQSFSALPTISRGLSTTATATIVDQLIIAFSGKFKIFASTNANSQEVALLLRGISKNQITLRQLQTKKLLFSLIENAVTGSTANEISVITYSLGKMRVQQKTDLPNSLKLHYYERLEKLLPFANPRDLSSTLWGLRECKFSWNQFPSGLKKRLLMSVLALDGTETRQSTANILLALGQLGFRYSTLSTAQNLMLQEQFKKFPKRMMQMKDMIQIFHGLACMGCQWSFLSPEVQFSLGECWFLAIQREIVPNSDSISKSNIVVPPSGTGLVLHSLAEMGVKWEDLPAPLRAGLLLALVYSETSTLVRPDYGEKKIHYLEPPSAGPTTDKIATASSLEEQPENQQHFALLRSLATIVRSLSRLDISLASLPTQAQDALFRILANSAQSPPAKKLISSLPGRSLSLILCGFADMRLSWREHIPSNVQSIVWRTLLSLPSEITSANESNNENLLQAVVTSLDALSRLNFPYRLMSETDKAAVQSLIIQSFVIVKKQAMIKYRYNRVGLKDIIVSGWKLVQLSSKLWDFDTALNETTYNNGIGRQQIVPWEVKRAYLESLSQMLVQTNRHIDFVTYFYEKEKLTHEEVVLLLKVLGDLRCSHGELAMFPVEVFVAPEEPDTNRITLVSSSTDAGSILSVTKSLANEILSSRNVSLVDYVLTVEALANLGHHWLHLSPRLKRSLVAGYSNHEWNRGSLMCIFIWSLGRLRYPWQSELFSVPGNNWQNEQRYQAMEWERHILQQLSVVLKASAVTNLKSWSSLLRGLAALQISFRRKQQQQLQHQHQRQQQQQEHALLRDAGETELSFLPRLLLRRLLYALYPSHEYHEPKFLREMYPYLHWSYSQQAWHAFDGKMDRDMLTSASGCLLKYSDPQAMVLLKHMLRSLQIIFPPLESENAQCNVLVSNDDDNVDRLVSALRQFVGIQWQRLMQ